MVDKLLSILQGFEDQWIIFFLSMFPVTELRVSIPLGISFNMNPVDALIYGVLGNLVPIIPILLLLPVMYELFCKIPVFNRFLSKIVDRTRAKGKQVEKYGALGLLLFVAVPLPGTGAWSGCLLAFLLGINFFYATIAISAGVTLAGVAVTLLTVGVVNLYHFIYGLEIIGIIILVLIVAWWIYKLYKRKNK